MRFPAWLATVLMLLVVWRLGRAVAGEALGRGSFIVCCTSPLTVFMAGGVMTDPYLVLGTALALLGTVQLARRAMGRGTSSHGWLDVFTVVLGLTISALAKGPIGVLFGGAPVFGLLLTAEGRRAFCVLPWFDVVLGFLILTVPWYVAAELRTPGFLEYFLLGEHVNRFLDPHWQGDLYGGTHPKPLGFVWLCFLGAILPWIPTGVRMLALAGWRGIVAGLRNEPLWGVILVALLLPLILFTFAGSLLPTYVYPCLPAVSVLLAAGVGRWADTSRRVRVTRERVPRIGALLMVPCVIALLVLPTVFWVTSSQRDVLGGLEQKRIIYSRTLDTMYSAAFYSEGRALATSGPMDSAWERLRSEPWRCAVVTKDRNLGGVPADVRARLQLERDVGARYQVWIVGPRTAAR